MICPTEKAALDELVTLRARPLCVPHPPLRMQWDDALVQLLTRLWRQGLAMHRRDFGHAPHLAAEHVAQTTRERHCSQRVPAKLKEARLDADRICIAPKHRGERVARGGLVHGARRTYILFADHVIPKVLLV